MTNATMKRNQGVSFVMPAVRLGHWGLVAPKVQRDLELEREFAAFKGGLVRALKKDFGAVAQGRRAMARQQINFSDIPPADIVVNGFRSLI